MLFIRACWQIVFGGKDLAQRWGYSDCKNCSKAAGRCLAKPMLSYQTDSVTLAQTMNTYVGIGNNKYKGRGESQRD